MIFAMSGLKQIEIFLRNLTILIEKEPPNSQQAGETLQLSLEKNNF